MARAPPSPTAGACRSSKRAGAIPTRTETPSDAATVKPSARPSKASVCGRGMLPGRASTRSRVAQLPRTAPAAAPRRPSTRPSARSWQTSRHGRAPRAERRANSAPRPAAPHEQQVGDVGGRDQQHEAQRPAQAEEGSAGIAHEAISERRDGQAVVGPSLLPQRLGESHDPGPRPVEAGIGPEPPRDPQVAGASIAPGSVGRERRIGADRGAGRHRRVGDHAHQRVRSIRSAGWALRSRPGFHPAASSRRTRSRRRPAARLRALPRARTAGRPRARGRAARNTARPPASPGSAREGRRPHSSRRTRRTPSRPRTCRRPPRGRAIPRRRREPRRRPAARRTPRPGGPRGGTGVAAAGRRRPR
jgi:hypothetical protein